VDARRRAGPAERDDVPDLGEREPEASALLDERKDARDLGGIEAIAGSGAARGRQDPSRLVEPYRLAAGSALPGKLADEKSTPVHAHNLNPSPWVKVKMSSPPIPKSPSCGRPCIERTLSSPASGARASRSAPMTRPGHTERARRCCASPTPRPRARGAPRSGPGA